MHSKALLKTGNTIMSIKGFSSPRQNKSHFISTMMNNRSITTNESSAINNSGKNYKKMLIH